MRKFIWLLALISIFVSTAVGDYYGSNNFDGYESTVDIPQFDSNEEILVEFVAPFLFLVALLNFILIKVLNIIVGSKDEYPTGAWPPGIPVRDDRPDVRKYSLMMSVSITGMLVVTPYWTYIRWASASLGLIALGGFIVIVIFVLKLMMDLGN